MVEKVFSLHVTVKKSGSRIETNKKGAHIYSIKIVES
jgi:hypothetical protein